MTDKQAQHKEKRKALRELSNLAKIRMKADLEGYTVNEILVNEFYKNEENKVFKTLHDWSKDGFQVLKGSKAFLVWGKPKQKTKETDQDEDEEEFFPLCYLFSNAQVKKK